VSAGFRRNAAVIGGLSLLCSLLFGAWTELTSGVTSDLYSVSFPEGTQIGYAVGNEGVILKTTDGGGTWVAQTSGTPGGLYSVSFSDNMTGYAVGKSGNAVKTTDGGASWNPMSVSSTDRLNYVRFPEKGQVGYIGVFPQAGGGKALKTTDGGSSWAPLTAGGVLNTSVSCAFGTDNQGIVIGNQGMVYGTTDGGAGFSPQGPNSTADMVAAAFSPSDPNTGYLIGNDTTGGIIRYTNDFGASLWDTVKHYPIASYLGLDMPTVDVAYFVGANGRIDRAVEAHDVFRCSTTVTVDMRGVCFPNGPDTGFAVGGAGTILRTYDGGIPWKPGVAEGKAPVVARAGIRVLSNPSRFGVSLASDSDVRVTVFDAAGRVVLSERAAKGMNFLPLPTGAYFMKAGRTTARAIVTD
jgi:photosystem II stability/assembly factor-like uncharacterized protein